MNTHHAARLAVALALLTGAAFAATASTDPTRHRSAPLACSGTAAVRHPLQVRVTALDPVRRGAVVRLRVTTTAERPVGRGEVALIHAGGAPVRGATRQTLAAIPVGAARTADFAVEVPATGHRFLVQFKVTAEGGAGGLLTRGAAFNILPDGPAERLHAAKAGNGDALLETAAERVTP